MSTELDNTADAGTQGAPDALAKGGMLGKYRLDRVLGEGGMGVVWAAHDPDLERSVAIKVLRYAQASTLLRQRLLREARAMAKLKHPNVLTVYEVGTVGNRDYIAMELVDGTSLDRWFAANPPIDEVWTAILAAGRGLAAAHDAGVVHRDFKPHNVLRSRDGRVLVTDFGLARGLLAEAEAEAEAVSPVEKTPLPEPSTTPQFDQTLQAPQRPSTPPKSQSGASGRETDSVLDAPLTQTGAIIGTPAYMAPEQFRGAPPDPRTDQFAFCVTAWQALAGDRPFKGSTIEELRDAVDRGVAGVPAKLPRDVRPVLARGLDPKPDARYPTLEALLDELEHAARRPQRRRRALLLGLASLAVAVAIWLAVRPRGQNAGLVCAPPEDVIAEAWSPALKAEISHRPGIKPESFARVAAAFDQFRERWIASYQQACGMRSASSSPPRISCLEGVRDEASTLSFMLKSAPAKVFDTFDAYGVLPFVGRCDHAHPDASVPYPKEQPKRSQVVGLMARTIAIHEASADQVDAVLASLEQEANTIGWKPALGPILTTAANKNLSLGRIARARELYARALQVVKEVHDRRMESVIRVNELDAESAELSSPGAAVPRGITDPHASATLHPELVNSLAIARSSTGDDPMLVGGVAIVASGIYQRLAQSNRYKEAYVDAIGYAQEARKQFERIGDTRRAAQCAYQEASIYLERGDERALDDALFTVRNAADAVAKANLPPFDEIDSIRIVVAHARGEYDEIHRLSKAAIKAEPGTSATISGRVVPAGRASVMAWHGDIVGDPRRAYDAPIEAPFEVVETAADGTFTIHAEPGWAILAETTDRRSTPQLVGKAAPVLTLAPTTSTVGTVAGKNLFGVLVFAEYSVGENTWEVEVPCDRYGSFDVRGLPPGASRIGLIGSAGDGERSVLAANAHDLAWPFGQNLDIIVRGKHAERGARVWAFPGKLATTPKVQSELEAVARALPVVAYGSVDMVGASNTDAGRGVYEPGDLHTVITNNPTGDTTVCAAARAADDSPVTCKVVAVAPTVSIDYPDGRFAAGVTPIVLEP